MPKKRPAREKINFRLERDLLEEMRQAAKREERSLNSYVTLAVRKQLEQLVPEYAQRGGKRR